MTRESQQHGDLLEHSELIPSASSSSSSNNKQFFPSDADGEPIQSQNVGLPQDSHFDDDDDDDDDDNDTHVSQWIKSANRLIELGAGTLGARQWEEAGRLLQSLRSYSTLGSSPKSLEAGFRLAERLCQECEGSSWRSNRPVRSLNQGSWMGLLVAWRDYLCSSATTAENTSDKQKRAKSDWKPVDSYAQGSLSVTSVLKIVDRCTNACIIELDKMTYGIILDVMKRVGDPKLVPHEAHEIYKVMLELSRHDPFNENIHPDVVAINELIEIWAQSWLPQSAQMAEGYFQALKQWSAQTRRPDMIPQPRSYCGLMEAHSRSSSSSKKNTPNEAFYRIQELFREMRAHFPPSSQQQQQQQQQQWNATVEFNRVCSALANCHHPHAPAASRAILDEMCESYFEKGIEGLKPSRQTFAIVLKSYAHTKRTKEAADLFDYMENLFVTTGDPTFRPDHYCYTTLIWAYAKVGEPHRAEAVLSRMIESIEHGRSDLELTEQVWKALLASWARSGHPDAADRIRRLILILCEKVTPMVSMYNQLLFCYAHQSTKESAAEAEKLFRWLEQTQEENSALAPDGESYLHLIASWCNAGEPAHGEVLLRQICDEVLRGSIIGRSILDNYLFNDVISAWVKSKHPRAPEKANQIFSLMKEMNIKPDQASYHMTLWALARSEDNDPAEAVECLFKQMQKQAKEGDLSVQPDLTAYNALLFGLTRSLNPTALERAEAIFLEMKSRGVEPDTQSYNMLMAAWMRRQRPDRTESLFREMKKTYDAGRAELRLTPHAYVTRLQAWSKVGDPGMAASVLREWISDCEAGKMEEKPRTQAFTMVLQATLNSKHPESPKRAESGLRKMIELGASNQFDCTPNAISFSAVIGGYAASDLPEAGEKALELFNLLKQLASKDPKNHALAPDFLNYAGAITALLRSRNDHDDQEAVQLLRELQRKERPFWASAKALDRHFQNIGRILNSCGSSSFLREEARADFYKLQTIAEEAVGRRIRS